MKKHLAEALINKGIMKQTTLLYGFTQTTGLGQTLQKVLLELMMEDFDGEIFFCRDRLGKKYTMHVDDVSEVDGMDPNRLASVFNIAPDGNDAIIGKKRGRKSKVKNQINIMEEKTHGEDKRTDNHIQT
jgi:hypothetical protein